MNIKCPASGLVTFEPGMINSNHYGHILTCFKVFLFEVDSVGVKTHVADKCSGHQTSISADM